MIAWRRQRVDRAAIEYIEDGVLIRWELPSSRPAEDRLAAARKAWDCLMEHIELQRDHDRTRVIDRMPY